MNWFRNRMILAAVLVIVSVGVAIVSSYNSMNLLIGLAEGQNKPSKIYYLMMERVYELANDDDVIRDIENDFLGDEKTNLDAIYANLIGLVGSPTSGTTLIRKYIQYQNSNAEAYLVYNVITGMGFSGDKTCISVLERLLDEHKHSLSVSRFSIARSLFLLTGKSYSYIDKGGDVVLFSPYRYLTEARSVILSSENRKRTIEEIVQIESLFRPPGY